VAGSEASAQTLVAVTLTFLATMADDNLDSESDKAFVVVVWLQ
jgi:hypothetical protein